MLAKTGLGLGGSDSQLPYSVLTYFTDAVISHSGRQYGVPKAIKILILICFGFLSYYSSIQLKLPYLQ